MTDMVRFSFALTPRMRAYLDLRDAMVELRQAWQTQQTRPWLLAACDLRASLLGEQGRKNALPELIALILAMQEHLQQLAEESPQYRQAIEQTCERLDGHAQTLQQGLTEAWDFLGRDALINACLNALKKQDWLGHKPALPQSLAALWPGYASEAGRLMQMLQPLEQAISELDGMLNDYVQWQPAVAAEGCGQITPERGTVFGLLVIGLKQEDVAAGIVPNVSGNRHAIRLRFQRWQPGQPPAEVHEDIDYAMMLVPVA